MDMKRIIHVSLVMLCVAALSLSLASCNGVQPTQEQTEVPDEQVVASDEPATAPDEQVVVPDERATAPEGLSDDIFSSMFSLNGALYTLPFPAAELEADGWNFEEGEGLADRTLGPYSRSLVTLINGRQFVQVFFVNATETELPFNETYIFGVGVMLDDSRYDTVIFPGHITLDLTYEEVFAAHGRRAMTWIECPRCERNHEYISYLSLDEEVLITIDPETNLVEKIWMFAIDMGTPTPAVVAAYEAPMYLDEWKTFILGGDEVFYRLPAPFSVFIENGWNVIGEDSLLFIGPGSEVQTVIRRYDDDNFQGLHVRLRNYDDRPQPLRYTFVVEIASNVSEPRFAPIELLGGMTEHSTEEEIMAEFGTYDYFIERDGIRSYMFGERDASVTFSFDAVTGEFLHIWITHRPEYLLIS